MPFDVIEIQTTPNPNAAKFILDRSISEERVSFLSAEQAQDHAIARKLFEVGGVSGLLLLGDFVTVNKESGASWAPIKRSIRKVLGDV